LTCLSESAAENSEEHSDETLFPYPEILKISAAYGITWVESDLDSFRQQLEESKAQESETLSLFMS